MIKDKKAKVIQKNRPSVANKDIVFSGLSKPSSRHAFWWR
jgi:hypothetical protein